MPATAPCLTDILQRADVWRGDRLAALDGQTLPSGFGALDAQLPGAGWPRGNLIELLTAQRGIGEISLLLPALRAAADEGPIAIVGASNAAHAPAWAAQLPLDRLIWVDAPAEHVAWSAEQLLASGAIAALLAWLPDKIDGKSMRRLQLAAEGCRCLAFVFRPPTHARQASPAPLRLALGGRTTGLLIDILKRRGPPCARALILQIDRPLPWTRAVPTPRPDGAATPLRSVPTRSEPMGVQR